MPKSNPAELPPWSSKVLTKSPPLPQSSSSLPLVVGRELLMADKSHESVLEVSQDMVKVGARKVDWLGGGGKDECRVNEYWRPDLPCVAAV